MRDGSGPGLGLEWGSLSSACSTCSCSSPLDAAARCIWSLGSHGSHDDDDNIINR